MSSQRSGPERSSRKRTSILQGVYEENVRTRRGEPSPRRRQEERERQQEGGREHEAPRATRHAEREPGPAAGHGRRARRPAVAVLAVLTALAVAIAGGMYATGQAPAAWKRLLPAGQASETAAVPFSPVEGGVASRALPATEGEASSVAGLFGLEVKTIVIDPGHGGKKNGAVGPGGTKEKHVALDVARRLRRRLQAHYGYRILMTRTGDRHLSLRERVRYANRHQADLFVSVHVNALPDPDVRAVETYYYGRHASEDVRRLARRENQASGYSVAEFDRLLEETGQRLRRQESERLAGSIQKSLFRNISSRHPEVRDWGVRTAPFVVLLGVEAPSVLTEIGVISSPDGEQRLRRPAYRARLARFLEEGIAHYLGARASPGTGGAARRDTGAVPPLPP